MNSISSGEQPLLINCCKILTVSGLPRALPPASPNRQLNPDSLSDSLLSLSSSSGDTPADTTVSLSLALRDMQQSALPFPCGFGLVWLEGCKDSCAGSDVSVMRKALDAADRRLEDTVPPLIFALDLTRSPGTSLGSSSGDAELLVMFWLRNCDCAIIISVIFALSFEFSVESSSTANSSQGWAACASRVCPGKTGLLQTLSLESVPGKGAALLCLLLPLLILVIF
mmetsp:Transcript_46572/g.72894  ORF Transcript_46572/g.72894 Transcript_46572/m.72894 type:complete len:226 (+) Transcript_46572:2260-2937(+)